MFPSNCRVRVRPGSREQARKSPSCPLLTRRTRTGFGRLTTATEQCGFCPLSVCAHRGPKVASRLSLSLQAPCRVLCSHGARGGVCSQEALVACAAVTGKDRSPRPCGGCSAEGRGLGARRAGTRGRSAEGWGEERKGPAPDRGAGGTMGESRAEPRRWRRALPGHRHRAGREETGSSCWQGSEGVPDWPPCVHPE